MSAVVDHFAVLGFVPSAELDESALRKAFFAKQRETHPDRFAHLAGIALDEQMQLAAQVNEAYRVLQDPFRRLEHLLSLRRAELGVAESSQALPPDFLMEVMDLNEEVDRLATHPDPTHAKAMQDNVTQHLTALQAEVKQALTVPPSPQGLINAQTGLEKMRYLLRLRESLAKFASPI
jgi:molecular chaperone HscB